MSAKAIGLLVAVSLMPVVAVQAQLPTARAGQGQAPAQLVINIPAARLDVWHEGGLIRSYPVAVGSSAFPTPLGEFEVTDITWNPWWIPPPSPWAAMEKPAPPGERNPMGRVKLRFAAFYFLHGTADSNSIGRAASHGCIRLRNADALELAAFVQDVAGPVVPAPVLDSLKADPLKTRRTFLDCRVPVTIRYDLAEVRDTVLHLYRDVYGRGTDLRTEALAALARAGLAPEDLQMSRLMQILTDNSRLPRAVPLRAIVLPAAWQRIRAAGR